MPSVICYASFRILTINYNVRLKATENKDLILVYASAQDGFELRWPWHKTRFHMLYVFVISLFSQTLFATYLSWTKLFPKKCQKVRAVTSTYGAPTGIFRHKSSMCVCVGGDRRGR